MERLKADRYGEFLKVLDRAYGMDREKWFMKCLPHIYADEELALAGDERAQEMVSWNYYKEEDGHMVSGLAIFPQKLKVTFRGKVKELHLGGIGSVFTTDEVRGKGHMSKNLEEALTIMEEDGYHLSWLSGERFRYGNYGWDLAGKQYKLKVRLKDLQRRFPGLGEVEKLPLDEDGISKLKSIYDSLEIGAVRDDNMWRVHLKRDNIDFRLGTLRGKDAYVVRFKGDGNFIPEIVGDVECGLKLLMDMMMEEGKDEAVILLPDVESELGNALISAAEEVEIKPCGSMRVMDGGRLERDLNIDSEEKISPEDRLHSWNKIKGLDEKAKINWWISTLDMV